MAEQYVDDVLIRKYAEERRKIGRSHLSVMIEVHEKSRVSRDVAEIQTMQTDNAEDQMA